MVERREPMSEGKNIIASLLQGNDIKSSDDIYLKEKQKQNHCLHFILW
jgi:hypothetical protein